METEVAISPNTLANRINEYIASLSQVTEKTRYDYRLWLSKFEVFVGDRIPDQKLWVEYAEYLVQKGFPRLSIDHYLLRVRVFFKWCVARGYVVEYPCSGRLSLPPHKRRPQRGFSDKEYELMKEAARGRNSHLLYPFIVASYWTGASTKDVAMLEWSSVDWGSMTVKFERSKGRRHACTQTVPILPNGDFCNLLLEAQRTRSEGYGSEFCFPELALRYRVGQPEMKVLWEMICKRCKWPIEGPLRRTHRAFRYNVVSRLLNAGVSTAVAMQVTGHKNPKTLAHYYVPSADALMDGVRKAFLPAPLMPA